MTIPVLESLATLRRGTKLKGAGKPRSRYLQAAVPAGVYVYESDAGQVTQPSAAAHVTSGRGGVTRYDAARDPGATAGKEWDAGQQVTYLRRGPMAVLTEEAVSDGDPVYVRVTAKGDNTQLGAFRNDADGDGAEVLQLTNALTTDGIEIDVAIDGVLFSVATGNSETADQKAALIATAIDAHAAFTATATGAVVDVARADGAQPSATFLQTGVTAAYAADSDPATAAAMPTAYFVGDHDAGVAVIDFDLP